MQGHSERKATAGSTVEHTAQLTVRIHPIGMPGLVKVTVTDNGPVHLSTAEKIRTLQYAIDQLRGAEVTP